jgi:hypothetical protein
MGISVGSQGLSRVIDQLFADLKGRFIFNFLDDLVVYSGSTFEHAGHLCEVLTRLQNAGFTLNPDKVTTAAREIKYLGHTISSEGIQVIPERIAVIQKYPPPSNLRDLRRFVGMVAFYARFIPNYSHWAAPLHARKRKRAKFVWDKEQEMAFDSLKQALCEAPVLQIPDFSREFVLATDVSDFAVSAVLQQRVGEVLVLISYYSRLLTPPSAIILFMKRSVLLSSLGVKSVEHFLSTKSSKFYATTCLCIGC